MPTVIEIIRDCSGHPAAQMEDDLDSLGLDSLEYVAMIQEIEETHGCTISGDNLVDFRTVEDVVFFVRRANAQQPHDNG